MRPVNKPLPAQIIVPGGNNVLAYLYQTQASINNTIITFAAGAVPTSYNAAAPFNRTVNRLLNDLLNRAQGNDPFPGGTIADNTTATGTIRTRLSDDDVNPPGYRAANPQLDARLGHYCSFCEIYKPGHEIAVEHRIPQGSYPVAIVWWGNFLQACSRCNSTKLAQPNFVTLAVWMAFPSPPTPGGFALPPYPAPGIPGPPAIRTNEGPRMQAIVDRHFWPDFDQTTFQRVTYQMQDAGNGYAVIASAEAANRANGNATFFNYAVTADMQVLPAGPIVANVAAEVVSIRNNAASVAAGAACAPAGALAALAPTRGAAAAAARASATLVNPTVGAQIGRIADNANIVGATPATVGAAVTGAAAAVTLAHQNKTDRTLQLVGLDVQDSARAGYRTNTWFTILGLITNFENIFAIATGGMAAGPVLTAVSRGMFDVFWFGLLVTAKGNGFYSTIYELLAQIPDPPYAAVAFANLAARFVNDADPANGGLQMTTIPGTDVTYIP